MLRKVFQPSIAINLDWVFFTYMVASTYRPLEAETRTVIIRFDAIIESEIK